jgi:hypothetical protein
MDVPANMSVFVSYAITDAHAQPVLDELSQAFSLTTARSFVGPMPSRGAIRAAISSAVVVVVLLPPPGNRDRSNVIFEAGVAVGMGRPVLIIAADPKLPRSLLGLPIVTKEAQTGLADFVRDAARQGPVDEIPQDERLSADQGPIELTPVHGPGPPDGPAFLPEQELIPYLADMFRAAGSEVVLPPRVPRDRPVDNADLVIWDDSLLPVLGAPLPVEVLRSMKSSTWARARLLQTLRASGAHNLLVVAAAGHGSQRWTDGQSLILTVAAETLSDQLQGKSLAAALASMLEAASI